MTEGQRLMDLRKPCRGLADILGAQEHRPVTSLSKLQILVDSKKAEEGSGSTGWIRQQVAVFEEQVHKLLWKINWLQESLHQEQSSRLFAYQQIECLQQMVLEQAANLGKVSRQLDHCFEEIEALHGHWQGMEARLEMERMERLRVEAMLRAAWRQAARVFPAFIANWVGHFQLEHITGETFTQWRFTGTSAATDYYATLDVVRGDINYEGALQDNVVPHQRLRLQEIADSPAESPTARSFKQKVVVDLPGRNKLKYRMHAANKMLQKKVARLCKLANNRGLFWKRERRQRLEAERKLGDLSASMVKVEQPCHVKGTQAPEEHESVERENTSLTLWEQKRGEAQPLVGAVVETRIGSLANRILQLKGTTGKLLKDLEGAYCMSSQGKPEHGLIQRRAQLQITGIHDLEQGKMLDLKARLCSMERQLHDLEGMACHKAQDLEQKLCNALEARVSVLDQQKWALRKRVQEKSVEVKQERIKRQEAEVRAQLERSQRLLHAETTVENSNEEFKTLRSEVERISTRVMDALQDVQRQHDQHCQLSGEVSRHQDMVWRQGLLALEQALLLCIAAFLVFSRTPYSPLAPPT